MKTFEYTRQNFVSCSDGIMLIVDLLDIEGCIISCTTMVWQENNYEVIF